MAAFQNESRAELQQDYTHRFAILRVSQDRRDAHLVTIAIVDTRELPEDHHHMDRENPNYYRTAALDSIVNGEGLEFGDYIVIPLASDSDLFSVRPSIVKAWND